MRVKRGKLQGFKVIKTFVSDMEKKATFYHVPQNPGASSLKIPQGPFLELYGVENYFAMHGNYKKLEVDTSTLDHELNKLGVGEIDLAKFDIQGGEIDALVGFQSRKPIFWNIETTLHPTYLDTPYGIDITKEIYDRGYLIFMQKDQHFRHGIVIWSDNYFMPNWRHPVGMEIIKNRTLKWEALIKMFSQDRLLQHIRKNLNI